MSQSKVVTLKVPSSLLRTLDVKPSKNSIPKPNLIKRPGDVSVAGSSPAPGTPQPHISGGAKSMAAVNASLRALDKSGKPCRKWNKQSIQIKSFTGVEYKLVSWKGASIDDDNEEGDAETNDTQADASQTQSQEADDTPSSLAAAGPMVKTES